MVLKPDQIARELADTRQEMGERLVELRRRGENTARRTVRIAAIAAAAGGAVAVAAVTAYIVYRVTRPPTARERIERVVPGGLDRRLAAALARARGRVPAVRLHVKDRAAREEPGNRAWERLVIRAAQAAGTAAAGTIANRLFARMARRA